MVRMTLAKALVELKTTEARIDSLANEICNDYRYTEGRVEKPTFVGFKRTVDERVAGTVLTPEEFNKNAIAMYDQYNGLITKQIKLKRAISDANNKYKVNIIGKEMTITEAIFYKKTIYYKELLKTRISKEQNVFLKINDNNEKTLTENANSLAVQTLAGTNKKIPDPEVISAFYTTLRENGKLSLIDPIDSTKKIEQLTKEIDDFKKEIDYILSEANAKNEIEVDL